MNTRSRPALVLLATLVLGFGSPLLLPFPVSAQCPNGVCVPGGGVATPPPAPSLPFGGFGGSGGGGCPNGSCPSGGGGLLGGGGLFGGGGPGLGGGLGSDPLVSAFLISSLFSGGFGGLFGGGGGGGGFGGGGGQNPAGIAGQSLSLAGLLSGNQGLFLAGMIANMIGNFLGGFGRGGGTPQKGTAAEEQPPLPPSAPQFRFRSGSRSGQGGSSGGGTPPSGGPQGTGTPFTNEALFLASGSVFPKRVSLRAGEAVTVYNTDPSNQIVHIRKQGTATPTASQGISAGQSHVFRFPDPGTYEICIDAGSGPQCPGTVVVGPSIP